MSSHTSVSVDTIGNFKGRKVHVCAYWGVYCICFTRVKMHMYSARQVHLSFILGVLLYINIYLYNIILCECLVTACPSRRYVLVCIVAGRGH